MEENTNVFLGTERVGKLMRGYVYHFASGRRAV